MIIRQNRIVNLSKLKGIKNNEVIRIAISDIDRFKSQLKEIGFSNNLQVGETVLPKAIGPVSKRNTDGEYEIHRDQEKETCYRMIEWTYQQWCGRGETEEVTDYIDVPYKRYPRTFIPPLSIELTVVNKEDELIIVSPEIVFNSDNRKKIIHTVNLFLEIFGECQILDKRNNIIKMPELIKLNWEILPQGKFPWEKRKKQIKKFIERAKGKNQAVVEKRLEEINKYQPDFTAIGSGGFNGYLVFGFVEKNIYVLESIYINNATYVLEDNWEFISRLTKAEILNKDLHRDRIIHTKSWYAKIGKLLSSI